MSSLDYSREIRVFDVIIGFILVAIGVYVTIGGVFTEALILTFFAVGLLFIGVIRTVKGVMMSNLARVSKIVKILLGIGIIGVSVGIIIFPTLAISTLIILIALALMMSGMSRAVVGYMEKELAIWARGLYVVAGLLTFAIGFIAAVFPTFGFLILSLMISLAIIFLGVVRILSGISGELR
ncbi:MAG: hypothetical protein P1Q69_07570 [Candidatus Thorarchaeota archaeon]|nr:hypothetical protein [Candidatus Thorarchaeota archaeon]